MKSARIQLQIPLDCHWSNFHGLVTVAQSAQTYWKCTGQGCHFHFMLVKTLWVTPRDWKDQTGLQGTNSRSSGFGNSTGAIPSPKGAASASLSPQIPWTDHRGNNRNVEISHTGSLRCSGLHFGFIMLKGGVEGLFSLSCSLLFSLLFLLSLLLCVVINIK